MLQQAEFRRLLDYKNALDQHAIIAETDHKGVILSVNREFERLSGYSRHELVGKNHRIVNSGYHSKEFFRGLWATITAGKIWNGEIRNCKKNGDYYWVKTTIVPFLNSNGKPERFVSLRTDVTKQKLAEKNAVDSKMQLAESAEILKLEREALNRKNIALLELIQSFDQQKEDIKANFRNQLSTMVHPILIQIKSHFPRNKLRYLELLEQSIEGIVDTYENKNSEWMKRLSPMELQIAENLRRGMSVKDIAAFYNISIRTVGKHCENIRKKLGITGRKINLQTFLKNEQIKRF